MIDLLQQRDVVLSHLDGRLRGKGFERAETLFYRRCEEATRNERIEGLSLRFEYQFTRCWVLATVKFPHLIELLATVRPFAYRAEKAREVPDFASHLAYKGLVRFPTEHCLGNLPKGLRARPDGILIRSRSTPLTALIDVLDRLIEDEGLGLIERLTLERIADVVWHPAYTHCGIAGAWPLAAQLAQRNSNGAARAFRRNPFALGFDQPRFLRARDWLIEHEVPLQGMVWQADHGLAAESRHHPPWLTPELLRPSAD